MAFLSLSTVSAAPEVTEFDLLSMPVMLTHRCGGLRIRDLFQEVAAHYVRFAILHRSDCQEDAMTQSLLIIM